MTVTHKRLLELVEYNPKTGVITWLSDMGYGRMAGDVADFPMHKKPNSYRRMRIDGKEYSSHRVALFYMTGEWPEYTDHINHIRDDNRYCNLRSINARQNQQNKTIQSNSRSGVLGVHWRERDKRWIASINSKGKVKHIGSFINKCDAITARKKAEAINGYHKNHGAEKPKAKGE